MKHRKTQPGRRGFTLVEILVVVAIISLLVTITMGVSKEVIKRVSEQQTMLCLQSVHSLLTEYHTQRDVYPSASSSSELADKLSRLSGVDLNDMLGERYKGGEIIDAWGYPIAYITSTGSAPSSQLADHFTKKNEAPLLASRGADGTWGTGDDLVVPE